MTENGIETLTEAWPTDLHDLKRRRPDTRNARLPDDLQSGDYWRVPNYPEPDIPADNLTRLVYRFYFDGFGCFTLARHTIREHEDDTISILPGDGSSNSVLVTAHGGGQAHGFFRRNAWSHS